MKLSSLFSLFAIGEAQTDGFRYYSGINMEAKPYTSSSNVLVRRTFSMRRYASTYSGFSKLCQTSDINKYSNILPWTENGNKWPRYKLANVLPQEGHCYGGHLLGLSYSKPFTITSNTSRNYWYSRRDKDTKYFYPYIRYRAYIGSNTNGSPILKAPPLWPIDKSCTSSYQWLYLRPHDAEGDRIRCRWSTYAEAGDASMYNSKNQFMVDRNSIYLYSSCILRYYGGYDKYKYNHFISIQVEDFDKSGKLLHSMPVQFIMTKRTTRYTYNYKYSPGNETDEEFAIAGVGESPEDANDDEFEAAFGGSSVDEDEDAIYETQTEGGIEEEFMTIDHYNEETDDVEGDAPNTDIVTLEEYTEPPAEDDPNGVEEIAEPEDAIDIDFSEMTTSNTCLRNYGYSGSQTGIVDVAVGSTAKRLTFRVRNYYYDHTNKYKYDVKRFHVFGPEGMTCGAHSTSSGYKYCYWTPSSWQIRFEPIQQVCHNAMDRYGRYQFYNCFTIRLKPPTKAEITCGSTTMRVKLHAHNVVPGLSSSLYTKTYVYIGSCKYYFSSTGHIDRTISLGSCGTKWSQSSSTISASYLVRGYTTTSMKKVNINARCDYASYMSLMSSAFKVSQGTTTSTVTGRGAISSLFKLSVTGSSSTITIGDTLTGRVTTSFAPSGLLYSYQIAKCTVYDRTDKKGKAYTILSSQCSPNSAVKFDNRYITGTRTSPPYFRFRGFTFSSSDQSLYVECGVNVCLLNSSTKKPLYSSCLKTCSGK